MSVPCKFDLYGRVDEESRKFTSNYVYADHTSKPLHAIAYRFADVFAIVDNSGKVISAIQGPDHFLHTPEYDNLNLTVAYTDICSDDKFIYCLYSGKKRMEEKDGEMVPNYAQKLHIFNWDGKPIASINLDYSVMSFDIDEQNNFLYTFTQETGGIVSYKLPQMLIKK